VRDPVPANPLAEGMDTTRRAPPGVLVVVGASGDRTARKLLPALERRTVFEIPRLFEIRRRHEEPTG